MWWWIGVGRGEERGRRRERIFGIARRWLMPTRVGQSWMLWTPKRRRRRSLLYLFFAIRNILFKNFMTAIWQLKLHIYFNLSHFIIYFLFSINLYFPSWFSFLLFFLLFDLHSVYCFWFFFFSLSYHPCTVSISIFLIICTSYDFLFFPHFYHPLSSPFFSPSLWNKLEMKREEEEAFFPPFAKLQK